jgi:flagellar hook-basal body complex protein FliE
MIPILPANLSIPPIAAPATPSVIPGGAIAGGATPGGASFESVFHDAVNTVENFRQNASSSVNNFLSGDGEELHDVAMKTQEAELSFDLFLQVRNKIVSAYQEVMRMPV